MADEPESRVARRRREREAKKEQEGSEGGGATASTGSRGGSRFKDKKSRGSKPQDKRNVREKRRATGVIKLDGSILDDDEDEEVKANTEINETIAVDSITGGNRNSTSLHVPEATNPVVPIITTPDNSEQIEPEIPQDTDKLSPRSTYVESYEEERHIRHSYWRRHARYDEDKKYMSEKNNIDMPEIKITCDEPSDTTKDDLTKTDDVAKTCGVTKTEDVTLKDKVTEKVDVTKNDDITIKVMNNGETVPDEKSNVASNDKVETSPSVEDGQQQTKTEDAKEEEIESAPLRRPRRARREELKYRSMPPGSLDSQEMHTFYMPPESPTENYKKLYDRERRETRRLNRRLAEAEQTNARLQEETDKLRKELGSTDSEIERLREENDALISAVTRMSIDRR